MVVPPPNIVLFRINGNEGEVRVRVAILRRHISYVYMIGAFVCQWSNLQGESITIKGQYHQTFRGFQGV